MLSFKNTTTEISNSGIDTVVLSVGATEQFGPYLPMHLDTLIAELYADAYGRELNAYVLPTIPFNTSEEHANFKGTVTVSPNILTAMLKEVLINLIRVVGESMRKEVIHTKNWLKKESYFGTHLLIKELKD